MAPTSSLSTSIKSPRISVSSDVVQRIRQANLVTRFNDLFAQSRMDAMDILRNHCDDHELNQKIVFTCLQVGLGINVANQTQNPFHIFRLGILFKVLLYFSFCRCLFR